MEHCPLSPVGSDTTQCSREQGRDGRCDFGASEIEVAAKRYATLSKHVSRWSTMDGRYGTWFVVHAEDETPSEDEIETRGALADRLIGLNEGAE